MLNEELFDLFSLNKNDSAVLFGLQYWLTKIDVEATAEKGLKAKKTVWLEKWSESIFKKSFWGFLGRGAPTSGEMVIKSLLKIKNEDKRLLIAFEALAFTPYFNMQHRESSGIHSSVEPEQLSKDKNKWEQSLFKILDQVGIDTARVNSWKDKFEDLVSVIDGRSKFISKLSLVTLGAIAIAATGGFAAPTIGTAIGTLMGLSGAAATSAGLAFLGGGAIASGGFGMAGGAAFIIGGGAMFGGLVGRSVSGSLFKQNRVILSQLAKLEATIIEIYQFRPNYQEMLTKVIDALTQTFKSIRNEIDALEESLKIYDGDETDLFKQAKSDLKALKKTKSYFEKAIKQLNKHKFKDAGIE